MTLIQFLRNSQFYRNVAAGAGASCLSGMVMAFAYPIYLHFLGYELYGLWLVLASVLSLVQLGHLGLSQAMAKVIAAEWQRLDRTSVQRYTTTALLTVTAIAILICIAVVVLRSAILAVVDLQPGHAAIASRLLPYVAIVSTHAFIVETCNSILSGFGRADLANYNQTLWQAVAVLCSTIALACGAGPTGMLIGQAVASVGQQITSVILIRRIFPVGLVRLRAWDQKSLRALIEFGLPIFGGNVIYVICGPFNRVMLSRYAGLDAVPVYEIACNIALKIRSLFEVAVRPLLPEVSKIAAAKAEAGVTGAIASIHNSVLRLTVLCAIPAYITSYAFAATFLKLWLRTKFSDALTPAFQVILVGSLLSLLTVPAYYTLVGLGYTGKIMLYQCVHACSNIFFVAFSATLNFPISAQTVSTATAVSLALASLYLGYQYFTLKERCTEV